MKNPKVKIFFVLLALILSVIACTAIFVVLLNRGYLTSLIEQQVRTRTNMDFDIGKIHMDPFSGLTLRSISIGDKDPGEFFKLRCESCAVTWNLPEILKCQVAKVTLSDVEVYVDTEVIKPGSASAYTYTKTPSVSIRDVIPHYISVKDICVENSAATVKYKGNTIMASEIDLHIRDFQYSGNPEFTISEKFSFSTSQSACTTTQGEIKMNGSYNLPEDQLTLSDTSHVVLNQDTLINVEGNVRSLTTNPTVDVEVHADGISMHTIPTMLTASGLNTIVFPTVEGSCNSRFLIQGNPRLLSIQSNISIRDLSLKNENLAFTIKNLDIPFEVNISPSLPGNKFDIEGKCMIKEGQLKINNEQIVTLDIPILFTLNYPHTLSVSSSSMKGNIFVDKVPFPIDDPLSGFKLNLILDHPGNIKIDSSIITNFSDPLFISGTIDTGMQQFSDFSIKIDGIDCNAFSKTMPKLIPGHYREWELNGCLSVDAELSSLRNNKIEDITMSTSISLKEMGFASPDYEYFGENITGIIETDISRDSLTNQFTFHTNCLIEPFLVQLGSFTTDMKKRQTRFSLTGDYAPQERNLSNLSGTAAWKDIGAITMVGDVLNLPYKPYIDVALIMKKLSHASLFETFIKDTIQYSYPALFQSHIKGNLNGQFHLAGQVNSLAVKGNININKTDFSYKDFSIIDLNIILPVTLTYPTSKKTLRKHDVSDSQYGSINIKSLTKGPLILNNLKLSPTIISNSFYIKDPLRMPVFGGTIEINDATVENILSPGRKVKFAFQFHDIDLEQITNTYKLTPLYGTLNSSLIPLEQKHDRLYSKGEMNINVFGGNITISNLTLCNFLTPIMGIEFSAKIDDLNLGEMSNTYKDWGGITGIVKGNIKDFKLVAGEPSSFYIKLKTNKVGKIKQTVSTKFLKKFVPGIGNILEKFGLTNYKYAVMGLDAILENDYITLHGAVREGGKDLFMKGAGLKKLEIVFHDANKKIQFEKFMNSFKGMLSSDLGETQVQFE
ncbi:MAG: hypothetical protein GY941_26595 [Planctomycetes bacterium]|nr:hypothetical protein [Planctomycetota bacterium]